MDKVLRFRVSIKDLDDKMYRIIEINKEDNLADLVYVILSSFNSLGHHLYQIKYNGILYDSMINCEDNNNFFNATTTKLSDFKFNKKDDISMLYDFGTPTEFNIKYIGSKPRKKGYKKLYPHIYDGKGRGILDGIDNKTLELMILKTDELGYSLYHYPKEYNTSCVYDYRDYSIYQDNISLKQKIQIIKYGYESIK